MEPGTFILEFPGVMHTVEILSYERAKQYYTKKNKDFSKIEMVTTLGSPITQYQYMAGDTE